jgi:hypothetical protein
VTWQQAFNFAVGASYVMSVRAAARTTPNFGAALEIRLVDQSPGAAQSLAEDRVDTGKAFVSKK